MPKLEDMDLEALRQAWRDAWRGLTYDYSPEEIRAAVAAILAGNASPEPIAHVRAIRAVRLRCGRCAGTGRFVTYVENGIPKGPGGICFRCQGRGWQTFEDGHRNRTRDNHISAA